MIFQETAPGSGLYVPTPGATVAVGWHDRDSIREEWPQADGLNDDTLDALLTVARQAVEAYAPAEDAPGDGEPVPVSWRHAQGMQARAVWQATSADGSETIGPEGYSVRVYPLDKNIRQVLRPRRGVPSIA